MDQLNSLQKWRELGMCLIKLKQNESNSRIGKNSLYMYTFVSFRFCVVVVFVFFFLCVCFVLFTYFILQ